MHMLFPNSDYYRSYCFLSKIYSNLAPMSFHIHVIRMHPVIFMGSRIQELHTQNILSI
ncbi:hypothetical protein DAI22_02g147600 [Oryza sativa Japonica Group]|nr:hypothetical protein DAI22_02g147600 [Oryza sativa Japonica Group]